MIQQFLTEVDWTGDTDGLDYLLVDTPPGTSDEHISTVQYLQKAGAVDGAIIVTTPEEVSLADVRKELNFCQKTKVPVLGVVENMAQFQTPLSQLRFYEEDGTESTDAVFQELRRKCPHVLEMMVSSKLFTTPSSQGPAAMAAEYNVPYWGDLRLDSNLLRCCEEGRCFVDAFPTSTVAKTLHDFAERLTEVLPVDTGA